MTDLEFLKFILYGDNYMESQLREEGNPTATPTNPPAAAPSSEAADLKTEDPPTSNPPTSKDATPEDAENTEQDNVEAEVTDSDVPDPSSNAEINKRIDNMVTGYISNINQGMSKGFKITTKDSSGQPVTTKTKISAVPLEGSKPVLDQQNKTLKFKIKINKDSSGETGMSKFLRGANAALGGVVNTVK